MSTKPAQKKKEPYGMTSPCPKCPFRNDIPGYLTPARVTEIERSLVNAEFPCHLTTNLDDQDEDEQFYYPTGDEVHCAGALILLEKLERPSQMMRIAERIGMYDMRKLDMAAPVFSSFAAMKRAQPKRGRS